MSWGLVRAMEVAICSDMFLGKAVMPERRHQGKGQPCLELRGRAHGRVHAHEQVTLGDIPDYHIAKTASNPEMHYNEGRCSERVGGGGYRFHHDANLDQGTLVEEEEVVRK